MKKIIIGIFVITFLFVIWLIPIKLDNESVEQIIFYSNINEEKIVVLEDEEDISKLKEILSGYAYIDSGFSYGFGSEYISIAF